MSDRRLVGVPDVKLDVTIRLTEIEARALHALAGYGEDAFLKVFYANLGKHYLQPHEAGIRSLFHTVSVELGMLLDKADDARAVFTGRKRAVNHPTRVVVEGSKI